MGLYTLILQYDGGTYIGQAEADDARAALRSWADWVTAGGIPELTARVRTRLAREFAEDEPAPILGVSGVWCCSASVRGRLGLVNIVRTAGNRRKRHRKEVGAE